MKLLLDEDSAFWSQTTFEFHKNFAHLSVSKILEEPLYPNAIIKLSLYRFLKLEDVSDVVRADLLFEFLLHEVDELRIDVDDVDLYILIHAEKVLCVSTGSRGQF